MRSALGRLLPVACVVAVLLGGGVLAGCSAPSKPRMPWKAPSLPGTGRVLDLDRYALETAPNPRFWQVRCTCGEIVWVLKMEDEFETDPCPVIESDGTPCGTIIRVR